MLSSMRVLNLLFVACAASATVDVLFKDVVIVGGGSSGAYAAVRLREDFGKSIALIEKESILVCHSANA